MNLLQDTFDGSKPVGDLTKPASAQEELMEDVIQSREQNGQQLLDLSHSTPSEEKSNSMEIVVNPETQEELYIVSYQDNDVSRIDGLPGGQSIVRQQDGSYNLVQQEGANAGRSEPLAEPPSVDENGLSFRTTSGARATYSRDGNYTETR